MPVNKISQKNIQPIDFNFGRSLAPLTQGRNDLIFRKLATCSGVREAVGCQNFALVLKDMRKISKWANNSSSGLTTLLCMGDPERSKSRSLRF